MRFSDLENARVAILGTGREGQAVWRQIRRRFPTQKVSLFAESDIDSGFLQQLNPLLDVCHVGPLEFESLKDFDMFVRSAGLSPYRQVLKDLRSVGKRFTSASSLWFAESPDAKTICISGTMGKSTTAALTAHLLAHAGVKTRLAGNIGRPMLDCDTGATEWWVIELSSYQLSDIEAKPDIAVLLNLSEEHVDWHGSVDRYVADKMRLAALVANGRMIANFADSRLVEILAEYPGVTWFNHDDTWQADEENVSGSGDRLVSAPKSVPGEHNMQNLAAALTVLDELGVEIEDINAALTTFTGLPHRLELLGEKAGIRYVNDSISTTPVSVAAALQTVGTKGVVLLLGGMDRGLDWNDFAAELSVKTPYAIIMLPDNGPKIFDCLQRAGVNPEGGLHTALELSAAVSLAQSLVPEKGCILLSPGAPSFPHFRDYEDRGNQFKNYAGIEKSVQGAH